MRLSVRRGRRRHIADFDSMLPRQPLDLERELLGRMNVEFAHELDAAGADTCERLSPA